MSVSTIDDEVQFEHQHSIATASDQKIDKRHFRPGQQYSDRIWAPDESAERGRFEQIQQRVIRLESALFEEFGTRINIGSLRCLERLFVACPSVRVPIISARPDGVLSATWRGADGDELAVRCDSPHALHYAITSRAGRPGAVDRQWGTFNNPATFLLENTLAKHIAE